MYRAVCNSRCNFCHFHCIARGLVHTCFPLSDWCTRLFESLFNTMFQPGYNSSHWDLFFNCALTHSIMSCFLSWVAETMVNLELNTAAERAENLSITRPKGVMTEICMDTSYCANSDLLLVTCLWSHKTENLLYFINNDEFSLVGYLWNYFWKMKYVLKILLFHSFLKD